MYEMPNGFFDGIASNHLAMHYSSRQMPSQYITKSDNHLIQTVAGSCLTCTVCVRMHVGYNYFAVGKTKRVRSWSFREAESTCLPWVWGGSGGLGKPRRAGCRAGRRRPILTLGQPFTVRRVAALRHATARPQRSAWNGGPSTEETLQALPAEAGWYVTTDRQMAPAGYLICR